MIDGLVGGMVKPLFGSAALLVAVVGSGFYGMNALGGELIDYVRRMDGGL